MLTALMLVLLSQEVANANTPKPVDPITSYRIVSLTFEVEPEQAFTIVYVDNNGTSYRDVHRGPSVIKIDGSPDVANPEGADAILRAINTGNFSTNSLIKRMLQHLIEHEKIPPATVTGTPGPEIKK